MQHYLSSILLIAAIALAAGSVKADDAGAFTVKPRFREGEVILLRLTKEEHFGDAAQKTQSVETLIEVKVLTANADGFRLSWQLTEVRDRNREMSAEMARAEASAAQPIPVIMIVTPEGKCTGLENEKEIVANWEKIMRAVARQNAAQAGRNDDPDEEKRIDALIKKLRPSVPLQYVKEPGIWLMLSGRRLDPEEASVEDETVTLPVFGGVELPFVRVVMVQDLNHRTNKAVITEALRIDGERMPDTLRKLAKRFGAPSPDDLAIKDVKHTVDAQITLDLATGIADEVSVVSNMEMSGRSMRQSYRIKRVEPRP